MSKSANTLLTFLAGVSTGALLGILYAPDKGSNTRDKLTYKLGKYKEKLEALIQELLKDKQATVNTAKSKGQQVISDAKEKAEKLLSDVDELIGQIKKENE